MLYEKFFSKLEKVRWNLEQDIAWNTINASLITDEQKELIRNVCMTEIGALFAAESFIRDFYDDIDFSCFVSVWYYEEMKHFMVLKKYLSCVGVEITEEELQHLRMSIPESSQEAILMIHFLSEHLLASWYHGISDWLKEAVGKDIFLRIAADEVRHGQSYFEFIQKSLVKKPESLVKYLQAAMFMLNPRSLGKHAVTLTKTTDRLTNPGFTQFIEGVLVTPEKKQATTKRIYSLLSLLVGESVQNYEELSQFVKRLKKRALQPAYATALSC